MDGLNGGDIPVSKGHLNPAASPPVARYPAPEDLTGLVRHFWVPEWSLPDGRAVTAATLPYPALNVVVEQGGAMLHGPTTRRSDRTLVGRGWAVGTLLRPAATLALGYEAPGLVDTAQRLDAGDLPRRVAAAMAGDTAAMAGDGAAEVRHGAAIAAVADWLRASAAPLSAVGALANDAVALVERAPAIRRVADLAAALHVTERTLQRALRRCTGFTPAEVIRRSRLQNATHRVRTDDNPPLARVAHASGYADHAHMTRDFREVLSRTPSEVRRRS